MILDLHLVLSSVGLSGQRPPTHTTRCPSSGTVLVSSHPFLKQDWLHTWWSHQPRKPLKLAALGKGIGPGCEGCPHAGLRDGEQSTSTHSSLSLAAEAHSG